MISNRLLFARPAVVKPATIALVLLALSTTPAHAQQTVAPNSLAGVEGDVLNRLPFAANGGVRYQQVYNASQFSSLSGPGQITQIAFRPDAQFGDAFTLNGLDVTIQLSTTAASADGLSLTFASNQGADVTTVYSSALSLSSAATGPAGGPKDFDLIINLTTPFTYNPAAGNLLLDIRNASPGNYIGISNFDATGIMGDSVSRVLSREGSFNDLTGTADTHGLITRFTINPIASAAPEPGTLALLALTGLPVAGAVTGRVGIRRRKTKVRPDAT
jgi:hypothetical protein